MKIMLSIFLLFIIASCATAPNASNEIDESITSKEIFLDARLSSLKMFEFIDYANSGDTKGVCELAELTLRSNLILLSSKESTLTSDRDINIKTKEKIERYLSESHCADGNR